MIKKKAKGGNLLASIKKRMTSFIEWLLLQDSNGNYILDVNGNYITTTEG